MSGFKIIYGVMLVLDTTVILLFHLEIIYSRLGAL